MKHFYKLKSIFENKLISFNFRKILISLSNCCAQIILKFLLNFQANEVSIFRVLQSDELWHFYFGRPITVYLINPENGNLEVFNLGPREDHYFFVLVPRGNISSF